MTINLAGYQFIETLHSGVRTSVDRAWRESDASSTIVKTLKAEYPTLADITRLRHEYQILHSLNLEAIIKAISLENYKNSFALILEDSGGKSLHNWMQDRKLTIIQFLSIALQLVSALIEIHKHNIIHKDIKPQNIIINSTTEKVKIIDFSIASRLGQEKSALLHPDLLEGTIAYMSPEQTGRMNRSLDYRTDFYSLGVTFYEMLTGELPFQGVDPLGLVHSHIAKIPLPPHQLNPEIPLAISQIVMKLLAKNAEDRYQSAEGLKFDLETCLIHLKASGSITNFMAGSADRAGQLNIPQNLYGRDREVTILLETFDRVATGTTELMLVSGYSGIGKTVLVNEVHKPIVRQRGYFIAGKFDQFKRNIPYASLIQAFQSLILQLLAESESEIKIWKERLLSALGINGQIIIDVIPEIELIIGKQLSVPELGAIESQNRFSQVFKQFISIFTTKDHPLVVFLDDLQWADSASLKLIELLITNIESRYLLLIGAYRDNEVSSTHPTIQTIEKIQQAGATVNNIVLAPLQLIHVRELIADTFDRSANFQQLAELLFNKSQGNPFFLTQLIKTLYQENFLNYDLYAGAWQWNLEQIQAIGITDLNVVELVARNIRKLSPETQKVLKLAACIGNTFSLEILSIVHEESPLVTAAQLWSALQAGLILPLSNDYKIPLVFSQVESGNVNLTDVKVDYKFLHDRVQQAAYSLIPEDEKKYVHLKIGQLLLHNITPEERQENIFTLVNQLNYGLDLLTSEAEKYELASLNLIAGQKAKAATAYESAVKYLNVGLDLISQDCWESQYDLTLRLHLEALEAEFITTHFERWEQLSEVILKQAKTLLEKVKVYELKIQFYISQNQADLAIETGIDILKMLGVSLEENPPQAQIIDELAELPLMTDLDKLVAMRILMVLVTAAFIGNGAMLPLILFTQISLSRRYGNSPESTYAYVWYGVLLCGLLGDIELGYGFSKLAVSLLERFESKLLASKVSCVFNAAVKHWKDPVKESLEPLINSLQSGLEVGDLEFAGHSIANYSYLLFFSGEPLEKVEQKLEKYVDVISKHKQEYDVLFVNITQQLVQNLLGEFQDKPRLTGSFFDAEERLPVIEKSSSKTLMLIYYVNQTILLYLLKDHEGALASANLASNYLSFGLGLLHNAIHNFYHSLTLLALYPVIDANQQELYLREVEANQEKMKVWAFHAPCNFQHKYDLVEAEKARVLGQREKAIDDYDRAIQEAGEQGYLPEEALANELAAEFHRSLGRGKIAKTYMTDAYYGYMRWGAMAKVEELEARCPQLLPPILDRKISNESGDTLRQAIPGNMTGTSTGMAEFLDLATVMKASQAISSEIVLANLLNKLMKILIENAGAEMGALISLKEGQFFLEATGSKDEVRVEESRSISSSQELPLSVLNYVARTQKDLIVNDASCEEIFNTDPYIQKQKAKSVLGSPIIYQGKLTAILYLENNVIVGAFTQKRVEVLRMLSAQVAIALENANLYHTLEVKVEERTQELQQKNSYLEVEIKERQRAEQAAEAANRAKSQFLANMSHELRTPLNGILGYTQILKRDRDLKHHQYSGINIIHQCGKHLLTLINDILDLSKIEAGKMELDLTEFHLSNTLQGVAEICRVRAQQKGISLIYESFSQIPTFVRADEKRLRQILINLLGNAVKFTETGGVTFTVERLDSVPSLSSSLAKYSSLTAKIRFKVEDTGIGIGPEELSKIFLPFEQVRGSVNQIEGTGLGLAISRQLVEMMGSELKVKSSLGEGSIFWFDLELSISESWQEDRKGSEKDIKSFVGKRRKILVVDDRWENRSVLVNLLAPLGFELWEATDGQDCINKALLFQPDCIIIDLVMPIMDGFEAIRQIRKHPQLKDAIAIGTSASILSANNEGICQAGCNAFLVKPIQTEELLGCLQNCLNLEWIYEEQKNFDSVSTATVIPAQTSEEEFIGPPPEELEILFDLAMKGELLTLERRASHLEAIDRCYGPFANRLVELAKNFEEDKLIEFVKQFR